MYCLFFFFNDTATTEIYTLSLHDALPISLLVEKGVLSSEEVRSHIEYMEARSPANGARLVARAWVDPEFKARLLSDTKAAAREDRKSTRLNSSHANISYAVFCLKKKTELS